jgi:3-methyladenine DNA glycosylase/8-oxoguanine DNA glycosylase
MKPSPDHPHAAAMRHLGAADARMAELIARAGPCRLGLHRAGAFQQHELLTALVEAIVGQQLSPKAADTIFGRVRALVDGALAPEHLLALPEEKLRGAGLSGAKTRSVRDLCDHVLRGELVLEALPGMEDEAAITALSRVRGIGRWTAEMVLMFQLGRPDVLPVGDLGVQKGFMKLFGLRKLPPPERMVKLAKPFRPYRSVACWYLWRINEEKAAAPAQ